MASLSTCEAGNDSGAMGGLGSGGRSKRKSFSHAARTVYLRLAVAWIASPTTILTELLCGRGKGETGVRVKRHTS